jgi:hypothetical protein
MTQRPSGNPNAGRINCFPTKTSQPFLSQSILSQPILSQSRGAPPRVEVKAVLNVRYLHSADIDFAAKCSPICPLMTLSVVVEETKSRLRLIMPIC